MTPEEKVYTEIMTGFYPATYGFENDILGEIPNGWQEISPLGASSQDISEIDGHKKVLYTSKGGTSGVAHTISQSFENQEFGEIEFWTRTSNSSSRGPAWCILDSTISFSAICMDQDAFGYKDNTGWHYTDIPAENNAWYHIKIQFECGTGRHFGLSQYKWRLYVDGEQVGDDDLNFIYNLGFAAQFQVYIYYDFGSQYTDAFTDAVGYSWDPHYDV